MDKIHEITGGGAVICAAPGMFAPGVSTRKVGKVPEKAGRGVCQRTTRGRICSELDAEVSALRDLNGWERRRKFDLRLILSRGSTPLFATLSPHQ